MEKKAAKKMTDYLLKNIGTKEKNIRSLPRQVYTQL